MGAIPRAIARHCPDFVKLADTFGMTGLVANSVDDLDGVINQMLAIDGPVIADIQVTKDENCFPMIPSVRHIMICCLGRKIRFKSQFPRKAWFWSRAAKKQDERD